LETIGLKGQNSFEVRKEKGGRRSCRCREKKYEINGFVRGGGF